MIIKAYGTETFSNGTLKQPVKMYHSGGYSSTTNYDIITSKSNCVTLGLIKCMVMDK